MKARNWSKIRLWLKDIVEAEEFEDSLLVWMARHPEEVKNVVEEVLLAREQKKIEDNYLDNLYIPEEEKNLVECPNCGAVGDPVGEFCFCPPEGEVYAAAQRMET